MTVLDANDFTPPGLWVRVIEIDDFPVRVRMGKETVILKNKVEARMFGLGLHFGDIMRCKQEGVEV
jgi:hypothetical protein